MKNWHWLLMVLSLVLALQACGEDEDGGGGTGGTAGTGGTGGGGVDTDNDGIPDEEDPTPNGSTNNKLNGTFSGGSASVVEITATLGNGAEDLDYVYNDDLTVGCDDSWYPQGTLCDESPTTDSPTTSTKQDSDSGATWYAYTDPGDDPPVTGFLVIDACSDDSCAAVDFNEARVFQMFSDGKTTHLRLSIHPDRGDTAPAWDDDGWVTVTDFEAIGAGTDVNGDALVVEDPTVFSTGPRVTRYVRVEARNDGTHDEGDYTELRSLKLFSVSAE